MLHLVAPPAPWYPPQAVAHTVMQAVEDCTKVEATGINQYPTSCICEHLGAAAEPGLEQGALSLESGQCRVAQSASRVRHIIAI